MYPDEFDFDCYEPNDGNDLLTLSDNEAWEDAQADMRDDCPSDFDGPDDDGDFDYDGPEDQHLDGMYEE